jgi:hypothetical protein
MSLHKEVTDNILSYVKDKVFEIRIWKIIALGESTGFREATINPVHALGEVKFPVNMILKLTYLVGSEAGTVAVQTL